MKQVLGEYQGSSVNWLFGRGDSVLTRLTQPEEQYSKHSTLDLGGWDSHASVPRTLLLLSHPQSSLEPAQLPASASNIPQEGKKHTTHGAKQRHGRMKLMQTEIHKKTELIKYILPMHYETHLPAEWNANFNFYFGLRELAGMKMTACIHEQPPANVCTHLLFPLCLDIWVQQRIHGRVWKYTSEFWIPWRS